MQDPADDVEVPAQRVVVVGLGLADRLNDPGGDPVGGAPQRLPAIRARVLGVQQDERHPRRRGEPFHLRHVLVVSLLIKHEQRRALRERPRGDHPPGGGGLTGAGRAEQLDTNATAEGQGRSRTSSP